MQEIEEEEVTMPEVHDIARLEDTGWAKTAPAIKQTTLAFNPEWSAKQVFRWVSKHIPMVAAMKEKYEEEAVGVEEESFLVLLSQLRKRKRLSLWPRNANGQDLLTMMKGKEGRKWRSRELYFGVFSL